MKKFASPFPRLRRTESTDSLVQSEASAALENPSINQSGTDILCALHMNEVQEWSEIVFGKKEAMDKKIDEILTDPANGYQLLRTISSNPQSIRRLAGQSICGIENRARKNAVEGLDFLYEAVYRLTKVSELKHGRVIPQTEGEYPATIRDQETSETPLTLYSRLKETRPFDEKILGEMKKDVEIQHCERQLRYLCSKIFGNSDALNESIADALVASSLGNHNKRTDLMRNLRETPEIYHCPEDSVICGFKNRGFRANEVDVIKLVDLVDRYFSTVNVQERILRQEYSQRQENTDISQGQRSEAVEQDIQHARAEHRPTPQQERPRRAESGKMALAM